MPPHVILLSIPGLCERDLAAMPNLSALAAGGDRASLLPNFPAVTCPVQANMTTGLPPREHGVIANGFYWREKQEVEMWTAWNNVVERPQIWDILHERDPSLTSAVWFALNSKGCGADYICTPAPVHNPDGSESLWCYTKPDMMYGELRDELGHFPLKHFWGPLAGIQSTAWIVASAILATERHRPNFFYIYLPHLDYAAQKFGPDSDAAKNSLAELDAELEKLRAGLENAYGEPPHWLVASEYAIVPVDHVTYPNRILREAALLAVRDTDEGEQLDIAGSRAFAMVDHQFSHIFVRDADRQTTARIAEIFRNRPGVAEVLSGDELSRYGLDHPRSGEIVLISEPNSWQAYYWWLDDARAPSFARTVDIHQKPGYDPVELFFDPATRSIPLDATLVRGSHGAPASDAAQRGVLLASKPGILKRQTYVGTDVSDLVLNQFTP
ncbi:MAG TPA: nucleotide pyrophosphatase/phosphodiesterase family protein [Lacipirellulaceae bacterium]